MEMTIENWIKMLFANHTYIFVTILIILFILLLQFIFSFSSNGANDYGLDNNTPSHIPYTLFFVVMVVLFIIYIVTHFWISADVTATNNNSVIPSGDLSVVIHKEKPDIKLDHSGIRPQVFNIPGNDYTFDDAKAVCSAYDARLATYD